MGRFILLVLFQMLTLSYVIQPGESQIDGKALSIILYSYECMGEMKGDVGWQIIGTKKLHTYPCIFAAYPSRDTWNR